MRRTKNRTIALCIVLIILSLIGAILSMQVSGEIMGFESERGIHTLIKTLDDVKGGE